LTFCNPHHLTLHSQLHNNTYLDTIYTIPPSPRPSHPPPANHSLLQQCTIPLNARTPFMSFHTHDNDLQASRHSSQPISPRFIHHIIASTHILTTTTTTLLSPITTKYHVRYTFSKLTHELCLDFSRISCATQ
jgi:hypothetical protein